MSGKIDDYGDVLSVKEVRAILQIGSNKIYALLTSGEIKSFKIGSVRKIPKWCLQEYIDKSVVDIHKEIKENVNDDCIKN